VRKQAYRLSKNQRFCQKGRQMALKLGSVSPLRPFYFRSTQGRVNLICGTRQMRDILAETRANGGS
jgi:hypothetical protein